MKKIVGKIFWFLLLVNMIWVIVSFFNIGLHNDPFQDDYKDYWDWNFFQVFFERTDN